MPLELLRHAPQLITRLVRDTFGIDLGEHVSIEETKASFEDVRLSIYHADLVLKGKKVVLIIELQLSFDKDKRVRWPLYTASAHSIFEMETWLIVIAFDPKVAEWAGRPIQSFQHGFTLLVIGPADIPRIIDPEEARKEPELAVLSAIAHAQEAGAEEIAFAALTGASEVAHDNENRAKLGRVRVFRTEHGEGRGIAG